MFDRPIARARRRPVYSNDIRWVPLGDEQASKYAAHPIKTVHDDILVAKLRPGQVRIPFPENKICAAVMFCAVADCLPALSRESTCRSFHSDSVFFFRTFFH